MAGGSSGGHGFGVPKEKKKQENRMVTIARAGSKEALANSLRGLGRNNLGSRSTVQRIKSNENERQSIRNKPRTEMHRVERSGRIQDERLTGSRAYPPKAQGAPALRKTVINPPAMNSVAPPKVEGVRPERPTRNTSTRNELEKAFRKQQKKKY